MVPCFYRYRSLKWGLASPSIRCCCCSLQARLKKKQTRKVSISVAHLPFFILFLPKSSTHWAVNKTDPAVDLDGHWQRSTTGLGRIVRCLNSVFAGELAKIQHSHGRTISDASRWFYTAMMARHQHRGNISRAGADSVRVRWWCLHVVGKENCKAAWLGLYVSSKWGS